MTCALDWDIPSDNAHDFSPDMRTLCELDDPWEAEACLYAYDVETGELMETISLKAGYDWALAGCPTEDVAVLFGIGYENQDVYLHIIHLNSSSGNAL